MLAILYLLMTEIRYNFQTMITERVHVNGTSSRGMEVEFDMTLPNIPCNLVTIDANDPTGQTQSLHLDRSHHLWKHRMKKDKRTGKMVFIGRREKLEPGSALIKEGQLMEILKDGAATAEEKEEESSSEDECGSCYGAGEDDECCNTCEDVKRAYQKKGWQLQSIKTVKQCRHELKHGNETGEGCNVHGVVALDSGGGNFHLAPSREMTDSLSGSNDPANMNDWFNQLIHRAFENWNVTHTINKIRFGESYPGHVHQLDEETRTIKDGHGMYQYYFKVRGLGQNLGCQRRMRECAKTPSSFCFIDRSNTLRVSEWHDYPNKPIQRY